MRIVLIGLHFAEIVARLALALSRDHDVEVYVAQPAADREWTQALRRETEAAVRVVYLPHPHRAWALWHGWRLARAVTRFAPDVVHVQEAAGWTVWAFLWLPRANFSWRRIERRLSSWPGLSRPSTRLDHASCPEETGSAWAIGDHRRRCGSASMAGTSLAMTASVVSAPALAAPAFVLTVHDPHPHSGDARARARTRWADMRVRRRADGVIVHGEALVRAMEAQEPSLLGRIHAVPHGALGVAARASPPPGKGRFLMFGRLQAYKGLGTLLDAVEILTAQNRRFEVLIAGTGDDLERRRARVACFATVKLDERYIPAEDVAALFGSCDAVVTPYLDATQSGVGALAFAAGRAVIATDVGALREVVRDGENGLIVPAGDALRLAEAMARILDEPGLAAQLGRCAREIAEGELSWTGIAERTVRVYQTAREAKKERRRLGSLLKAAASAPPIHPGPDLD